VSRRPDFGEVAARADAERIAVMVRPLMDVVDAACSVGGMCPVHARVLLMTWLCVDLGRHGWTPGKVGERAERAATWGAEACGSGGDGGEDDDEAML
jgi:hypothetical protein